MKIAALTMVYRDHWYLRQWLRHYDAQIGRENCVILSHGDEPEIREIAEGAQIIPYARTNLENFDDVRWKELNARQAELHDRYDCVITGDVDELIFASDVDRPLSEVLQRWAHRKAVFSAGFDLVQHPTLEETFDDDKSVWHQRRFASWAAGYSKPSVSFSPVTYRPGAHRVLDCEYFVAPGLHLAHLHYADDRQLGERDRVRHAVSALRDSDKKHANHWKPGMKRSHPLHEAPAEADVASYEESYLDFYSQIKDGFRGRGHAIGAPRVSQKSVFRLPRTFQRIPAALNAAPGTDTSLRPRVASSR